MILAISCGLRGPVGTCLISGISGISDGVVHLWTIRCSLWSSGDFQLHLIGMGHTILRCNLLNLLNHVTSVQECALSLWKMKGAAFAHLQGVIDNEGNRMRGFFDAGSWIEYLEVTQIISRSSDLMIKIYEHEP